MTPFETLHGSLSPDEMGTGFLLCSLQYYALSKPLWRDFHGVSMRCLIAKGQSPGSLRLGSVAAKLLVSVVGSKGMGERHRIVRYVYIYNDHLCCLSGFQVAGQQWCKCVEVWTHSQCGPYGTFFGCRAALITNYQLPDGPVKAGRRWGQRHPQGANLGSNGILKFLSKLKQSAATSPP